jgi:hypothetical protein
VLSVLLLLTIVLYVLLTTQWSKEEGQTTQWSKEEGHTTQWSKEE